MSSPDPCWFGDMRTTGMSTKEVFMDRPGVDFVVIAKDPPPGTKCPKGPHGGILRINNHSTAGFPVPQKRSEDVVNQSA